MPKYSKFQHGRYVYIRRECDGEPTKQVKVNEQKYQDRLDYLVSLESPELSQSKLQILYLYLLAIGGVEKEVA